MRSISKALVGAGIVAVAVGTLAGTALAEPSGTPTGPQLTAAGSDTIQGLGDQFQADYSTSTYAAGHAFFSYDATGTANITPKKGCTSITRPNGSGAGITALGANARPSGDTTHYCLDMARASRGPSSSDPTGLAWVPIAGDGVTWAAETTTNAPKSLTTAQLTAIYNCDDSSLGGDGNPVTWNEVGGTSTDAVVPVIPQSSSGTRSFFLSQIGVTTLGSCVQGQDNSVEENEGTNAIFTGSSAKDIVFPYSIAVFLTQIEHSGSNGMEDGHAEGPLHTQYVNKISPTTGTRPSATINPSFPYQRNVYLVTRSTGKSAGYVPTYLQAFLGKDDQSGFVCGTTGTADLKKFGFLSLGSKCGVVTLTS